MKVSATSLTIGELLQDGKIYTVPPFQRSYSWEKEQIENFWADLKSVYENGENEYFVGSMIFTPDEGNKIKTKVLDGQQRFSTVLLFLSALRDALRKFNTERKQERIDEINKVIYKADFVTLEKNPKLELNNLDSYFYEQIVVHENIHDPDLNPKYNSHKLIKEAYCYFENELTEKIELGREKFVSGIIGALTNKFLVIKIEVDTDVNAQIIFETLNDRGLALSEADLIKNYLFSIAGKDLDLIKQDWKEIIDQIGDQDIVKFLRHFWSSSFELVRREELYKKLREKVKGDKPNDVKAFMQGLSKEVKVYSNLNNPTPEFWLEKDVQEILEELNVLCVEQVYILLLSLYNKFYQKPKTFKRLLRVLVNFTFRYNTICGENPNQLERLYSTLAIKVRKGEIDEHKIIEEIKETSPSNEKFINSFSELKLKKGKLAKYILFKINNYLLKEKGEKEITTDINKVNLEHIIPKKPDQDWKDFFEKNSMNGEDYIYKIGNMTILLSESNSKISNKFFNKKQQIYK